MSTFDKSTSKEETGSDESIENITSMQDKSSVYIIGVCGETGSGKTSFIKEVYDELEKRGVDTDPIANLSIDSFYSSIPHDVDPIEYNFDDPKAIDYEKLEEVITNIRENGESDIPIYSFHRHEREKEVDRRENVKILFLDGIFTFYFKEIRDMLDFKIYIEADADTRLDRRIRRDMNERGRGLYDILEQWDKTVKPSSKKYVKPTQKFADITIPNQNNTSSEIKFNQNAIKLIVQHIQQIYELEQKDEDIE